MKFFDSRRTHRPFGPFQDDLTTRTLIANALFTGAVFIILLVPWIFETRTVEGVNLWTKPQKFGISLPLHFLTLAILAQLVPRQVRVWPTMVIATYLSMLAVVYETLWVVGQAALERRSHFNFDTQIDSLLYALAGLGALFLLAPAIVLGVHIWRKAETGAGLKTGAVLGLLLGSILTILMAGYMSGSGSRWVGGPHPEGGAVLPFFGWSREVGDLRPAHFVALHMIQTMPVVGWLVDRIFSGRTAFWLVIVFGLLQSLLAIALFMQALAGQPVWPT